jgi:hypothetical protein
MTTQKTRMGSQTMRRIVLGVAALVAGVLTIIPPLLLVTGALSLVQAQVPPNIPADGCGGAVVFGNGGSQCDGPVQPDGSFQRCTSVYVLGIGGWTCFMVYPPPNP